MKIKSINDVITNSSDETYIVKTNFTPFTALELFKTYLKCTYPESYDDYVNGSLNYTYIPTVDEESDGKLRFDWSIMCNLNNAYEDLCAVFGIKNVK